jgi:EAL domain-containing protein (putative c-di-GMP-specific phosphodiesterase class I)
LRQAAQEGGFALAFQPRRRMRDSGLLGAQAQLRWPRRRGGMTQAIGFMPLLEECGLADEVATWAMRAACEAAAAWPHGQVSVPAAGVTWRTGKLLAQVGAALACSGLAPERLEIEIAEPLLAADSSDLLLVVSALRDLGVGVALDAFGSDTASLLVLKRLPLTALKLDRSLVRDLPHDRDAAAVVLAVTDFAHAMDVSVAAVGMDTVGQRDFLRRAGCDEAQGTLCGRAESAAAMHGLFEK